MASAKQSAGQVTGEAREQAAEVMSSATDQLGQVMGTAREELRNRASAEATNLGQRLGELAVELRAMGLASAERGGVAATAVCGVADQVDRGARRLSQGDLDTAVDDLKRFARNRPGTFLLGAVGAGFAVGRLLRHADLKEIGHAAQPADDRGVTRRLDRPGQRVWLRRTGVPVESGAGCSVAAAAVERRRAAAPAGAADDGRDVLMADVRMTPPSDTEPIEADKPLAELLSQLTSDFSSLVTTHIELAKVEIKEEVTKAGKGAGLLGGGAFAGVMAVLLLSFAAAWGLAEVVPEGVAFLIVGLVWAAVPRPWP